MNPNEQPQRYDLEKAHAEADEMKKMIVDDENEINNYKDAEDKIEQQKAKEDIEKLIVSVSNAIPNINLKGLTQKGTTEDIKWDKKNNIENQAYDGNDLSDAYAVNIYHHLITEENQEIKDLSETIANFKDQIVVDLGAGDNKAGYLIADLAKAKHYIAIEPFFTEGLIDSIKKISQSKRSGVYHKYNHTPISIVQEDMLSFLRRLPDNSVSLFCSGVDNIIIPDGHYRDETAKEIARVLNPSGAYIGNPSGYGDGCIIPPESGAIQKKLTQNEKIILFKKNDSSQK